MNTPCFRLDEFQDVLAKARERFRYATIFEQLGYHRIVVGKRLQYPRSSCIRNRNTEAGKSLAHLHLRIEVDLGPAKQGSLCNTCRQQILELVSDLCLGNANTIKLFAPTAFVEINAV